MAAMDKLRVAFYCERNELIVWCIKHKPSLLNNIYNPFGISQDMWDAMQDEYKGKYNIDVTYPLLTIANFTLKQDRYLYWHCPLDFVRAYLHEQCGYKDNWFVKLFWRK
jgi:hypothetical protein